MTDIIEYFVIKSTGNFQMTCKLLHLLIVEDEQWSCLKTEQVEYVQHDSSGTVILISRDPTAAQAKGWFSSLPLYYCL